MFSLGYSLDLHYLCTRKLIIMYDQIREDILFILLYTVVTVMATMASIYLLLRRGNAFAADITTPLRLRHWTAAFFGVIAVGHLWYIPTIAPNSADNFMLSLLIGALLDCLFTIPLGFIVMLSMLQDRQRPLWPVTVMVAPLVVGMVTYIFTLSDVILFILRVYFLLMSIGFIIYMIHAVRQYSQWLRENYADLEHKEVWQSFLVLATIMLIFGYYVSGASGMTYEYIIQVSGIILICYLLWRVETLSDLSIPVHPDTAIDDATAKTAATEDFSLSSVRNDIGSLLKHYCEEPQLYLKHDMSLSQVATLIGINRTYLSKHFAMQGITYNAYINALRIQHFVNLCHEKAAAHQPLSVLQLALESGFRSYNTFNTAFKQSMGTTATEWLRNLDSRY